MCRPGDRTTQAGDIEELEEEDDEEQLEFLGEQLDEAATTEA